MVIVKVPLKSQQNGLRMSEHDQVSRQKQLERLHDTPKVIRQAIDRGEFGQLEDGFWYYWPTRGGAIGATVLRLIADELDARNKKHEEEIDSFFSGYTPPEDDEIPF